MSCIKKKNPKSIIRCLLIAFIEHLSDLWGAHKNLKVWNASFTAMSAGVAMQKPQHIEDKYVHCPFSWALVWPHQCCLPWRGLGSSPIFLFPQFPSLSSPCCQCRFWASIQIWFSLSFWVFCWKPRHWASAAAPPSPALPFSGGCHLSVPCCSAGFSLLDKRHSIRAPASNSSIIPWIPSCPACFQASPLDSWESCSLAKHPPLFALPCSATSGLPSDPAASGTWSSLPVPAASESPAPFQMPCESLELQPCLGTICSSSRKTTSGCYPKRVQ